MARRKPPIVTISLWGSRLRKRDSKAKGSVKEITDSCIQSGSIWSFGPEHPILTQKKAWKKLQGWEQTRKGHKEANVIKVKVGGRLSETSTHVNPDLEKDLVGCFVDKFFEATDGGLGLSQSIQIHTLISCTKMVRWRR